MSVRGQVAECNRVVGGAFDLAAGDHASGVAVDQQAQQYRRMMRLMASASILLCQRRHVQLLDHINDKTRQMLIGQPLIN